MQAIIYTDVTAVGLQGQINAAIAANTGATINFLSHAVALAPWRGSAVGQETVYSALIVYTPAA